MIFEFLGRFSDELLLLLFPKRLRWKHTGEIKIVGDYFKTTVKTLSNIVPERPCPDSNRFLWKAKTYSSAAQMFMLLCGPRIGLYKVRKLYRNWNSGLIGINSSTNEPIWYHDEGPQVIWQRTSIHRNSPYVFTLIAWKVAKTTAHQRLISKFKI